MRTAADWPNPTGMTRQLDAVFLAIIACAIVFAAFWETCSAAQADDRNPQDPALMLARVCVSEAGWTCWESGDGLAIHEVLLRGAARERLRYTSYARAYSPRATGAVPDTSRRAWLSGLWQDGAQPPGWPAQTFRTLPGGNVRMVPGPRWSNYAPRWLAILARAREVVTSDTLANARVWHPCATAVHDWGGAMDRARAERLRLVHVACGGTANDFYQRPHLSPDVE